MPIKICNDAYGYGCTNFAEYTTDEELERVFRKVKTHTGTYFRNTCKECESKNFKNKYYNKNKNRFYDWWDYGETFGSIKL